MSSIDTLLDNAIFGEGEYVLTIDEPTRTIVYNGELIIGVEGDCQADKIHFIAPKIVGDGIDLSAESTQIYIKFKNATTEPYFIECCDRGNTPSDLDANGDYIKFSWLLTEKVTEVKGTVEFLVCVKTDEDVPREWHTTVFTGKVLKGIDVEGQSPEIIPDETVSTYKLIQEVNELRGELRSVDGYVSGMVTANVEEAVSEGLAAVNADIETLETEMSGVKEDIELVESKVDTRTGEVLFMDDAKTKSIKKYVDDANDVLEEHINNIDANKSQFKLVGRTTLSGSDYYADIESIIAQYSELMIVVKTTNASPSLEIGVGNLLNNTTALFLKTVSGTTYNKFVLNKTDDGYYGWEIGSNLVWSNWSNTPAQKANCVIYRETDKSFGASSQEVDVAIYCR